MKKNRRVPFVRAPKAIIICYSDSLMDYVKEHHRISEHNAFGGKLYLLKESQNQIGILGNTGIGSPAIVTAIEESIALGTKAYIAIGTAGTLQHAIKPGDLVLCTRAIRDEGTSFHYLKSSKYAYPSQTLTTKIESYLRKKNLYYKKGTSWTIDAPYRETVAEVKQYQKQGVLTVEMEASALFAVAQYHHIEMAAMFVVSDSLADLVWKPDFHRIDTKSGMHQIYTLALDILKKDLRRRK